MTQKRTSAAKAAGATAPARKSTPLRVVMITLDKHMASAVARAGETLQRELPGLELSLHAVAEWRGDDAHAETCRKAVAKADIIVASMIFLEEHARLVGPMLAARRDACDCVVGALSAADVVKQTSLGRFDMAKPTGGMLGLLKRLRGKARKGSSAGHGQMKMLRALPRLLRYIPGGAQDVRAYFLTLQYLLAGSEDNLANLIRFLAKRYAAGPRAGLRDALTPADPILYPDVGLYHPALPDRATDDLAVLAKARPTRPESAGTVGLLVMRSYILAKNTAHYDGVIAAMEARGLNVTPAYASGLDARPAIDAYFMADGRPTVDAVVSLTGFSLVGGPAYNDAAAAEAALTVLDVPYLSAFAIEFQTLDEWRAADHGLTPVETTIMTALPEIDGATGPILFGGRAGGGRDMEAEPERAAMLAARTAKLVALRKRAVADRRVAAIIYNFPPNGGAVGSAAHLSVFRSLWNTLAAMRAEGYTVDLPADADALKDAILGGTADLHGMPANVAAAVDAEDHVRSERFLDEIETQWGPAPGREQSDGRRLFVLGAHFGNVFVGVQPAFGYEGDPMRLLFEKSFAPTHAFSAFYRYIREDFGADVALHFGTHGALEFMPGKQVALSGDCWPDRLLGDLPNVYFYAANNPSEATIAKRRSAATLVSYLTPPVTQAGLYKGLLDIKSAVDRWRGLRPEDVEDRKTLAAVIREQAAALDLIPADTAWSAEGSAEVPPLAEAIVELEHSLIPHGLHVAGEPPTAAARRDLLQAVNRAMGDVGVAESAVDLIADGDAEAAAHEPADPDGAGRLARLDAALRKDSEIDGLLHALGGGYVRPVSGGDVLRSPEIAPTGRNIHGFDPFRLPSAAAFADGRRQADRLLERYIADNGAAPRSLAVVLWGADNLKTEGAQIAQALALIGATPRFDGFGRLAGADLIPLAELGRARVDVLITLSGIFRDLLSLQTKMLADACYLAATADEPSDLNPIRAHALAHAGETGCSIEDAALRVFSNAAGAYGSNVNMLIDSGAWDDGDELAETYASRKCFAYGRDGQPVKRRELLEATLKTVEGAYQNIESIELGITSIDHYFDTLGGISRAVRRVGGEEPSVYVGDETTGTGKVRSLDEQVALETRTRMLNPKWYDGMLDHGYEGVRQIESHVTNMLGWSATTGKVEPWVYQHLSETYVLDEAMRRRLSALNPKASAKLANRLIEACERDFWKPDEETWNALLEAGDELEDRVEGVNVEFAA